LSLIISVTHDVRVMKQKNTMMIDVIWVMNVYERFLAGISSMYMMKVFLGELNILRAVM